MIRSISHPQSQAAMGRERTHPERRGRAAGCRATSGRHRPRAAQGGVRTGGRLLAMGEDSLSPGC